MDQDAQGPLDAKATIPGRTDEDSIERQHAAVVIGNEEGLLGGEVLDTEDLGPGVLPPALTSRLNVDGVRLAFFSTIAQFGSAEDIALADLRIELLFPIDAATRLALETMATSSAS